MKSFLQILALESRLFETLLKRRSGQAECSGGLLFVFSSLVPQKRYTLDCPREEILVSPPPSYIFVMNEDLCGVYPTPTGVYIRKPLERGEEVMVLQPGFQGTKAVYYYHNDKSQLFVLCEDNRKLIIYDLITEKSVAYSILGLPGNGSRSSKNADLVCNPLFAFFLAATGHLFCIDLRTVDDDALQAKLIWTSPHSASPESSYGTVRCMTGAPEAVMVTMAHVGDITTYFLGIEHPEKPPLYFTELCKTVNSLGLHLPSDHAVIIPFDDHLNGFVMRTYEHGCSYRLSLLSDLGHSIDIGYRLPTRQSLQIVIGAKDVIYMMRQDTSMVSAAYESSDGEIMALELRVLETMLEKSGRSGTLPEVGKAYMDFLGTRPCTLDCPREEVLANPPPSYIFVMNEDLCGVYPTPTGVYIRKPLERGEEVMVLQPGFQGTKAVYYYNNNNKSQLFVLCEDNRKLIQYNLSDSPVGQGVTTEVLGLPKATALNKTASQLLYTDDFVFIIFPTGHLFCIDRLDIRDAAQAKLISADRLDAGSTRSLLSVPGDSKAVKLAVLGYRRFKMITLKLKQRRSPLYFEEDTEELDVASKLGETNSEMMLVQDVAGQCLAVMARSGGVSGCRIFLCSRSLRPLGKALVFSNEYQPVRNLQVVFGADDLVYVLREDNTLVERFLEEDYDPESVHESELRGDSDADYSRACRLATYYIYR